MAHDVTKFLMCALLCSLPAAGAWADGAVYAMTNAVGNNQIVDIESFLPDERTLIVEIRAVCGNAFCCTCVESCTV